ncbi:LuxR family transcriptional regulator, partial [Streptomyces sp. NPDC059556]
MLEALGIKESTEAVYRLLLERPEFDVTEMAAHLGRPDSEVREALAWRAGLKRVVLEGASGVGVPFHPDGGGAVRGSRA